eukprot:SAG11_NODE_24662_length_370_cov_0.523985_1_plen_27_part_01
MAAEREGDRRPALVQKIQPGSLVAAAA